MNNDIKHEGTDFVVQPADATDPLVYEVQDDPGFVPEGGLSAADRRHQMALKLALLKQIIANRKSQTLADARKAKKRRKNRAKNRVAAASRRRNRGR